MSELCFSKLHAAEAGWQLSNHLGQNKSDVKDVVSKMVSITESRQVFQNVESLEEGGSTMQDFVR